MSINGWAWVLAVLGLASCSAPHQLIRVAPELNDIVGIRSALDRTGAADVVLVHGMCYHDRDWVLGINDSLASDLGLSWNMSDDWKSIGNDDGRLYINELVGPSGVVRTFAILWAPVTTKVKTTLCYDATTPSKVCQDPAVLLKDQRVWANAVLKNSILDECLADAVYYVGQEGHDKLHRTIQDGLTLALAGGQQPNASEQKTFRRFRDETNPLFVVTQSLGSKMFLDTVIEMANQSQDCASVMNLAFAIGRTNQVFMEANQIPMLALAYNPVLSVPCPLPMGLSHATGMAALAALYQQSPSREGRVRTRDDSDLLKVAAFSDPNDILSYTLVPVKDQTIGHEVVDIVTGNDWTYLGILENPYNAHTMYGDNPVVLRVIACGSAGLKGGCAQARTAH